ncbi:MAG: amidohydrolase family protein [Anaerolineae bacterium]|nr:amidohydrolase family protein [Anaerolineae bacterium]
MGLLIWAGTALPDAETSPQDNFAVYVEDNTIVAAGDRETLKNTYPTTHQVGGPDLLLCPAFVNSHDHGRALGTASLGIGDDLLEIWLPGLWAQPMLDPYLAAVYDGLQLLHAGVGTTAHSHNPRDARRQQSETEATLRGYRDVGIRVACHPVIVDQNPLVYNDEAVFLAGLPSALQAQAKPFLQPKRQSPADYFSMCAELVETYHDADQHTAHIQVSPAGGQWCSDDLIMTAVAFAQRHQTRVQMHMLETRYQQHYARRRWGHSFIQHLETIGALGPWLTLAHMVWVDKADLPLLAERGVGIAHNPSSNLRLRSGVAPIPPMLAAGLTPGIGLDGHALDEDQDYLREMRLAWTLANRPGATSPTISANTIWQMGTVNGAAISLGPDVPLGTLAPGSLADLVLLDWQAVRGDWAPDGYPAPAGLLEFLLRKANRSHVRHVMINGEWSIRDGQSSRVDTAAITQEIKTALTRQTITNPPEIARTARALAPYLRQFYAHWEA